MIEIVEGVDTRGLQGTGSAPQIPLLIPLQVPKEVVMSLTIPTWKCQHSFLALRGFRTAENKLHQLEG